MWFVVSIVLADILLILGLLFLPYESLRIIDAIILGAVNGALLMYAYNVIHFIKSLGNWL